MDTSFRFVSFLFLFLLRLLFLFQTKEYGKAKQKNTNNQTMEFIFIFSLLLCCFITTLRNNKDSFILLCFFLYVKFLSVHFFMRYLFFFGFISSLFGAPRKHNTAAFFFFSFSIFCLTNSFLLCISDRLMDCFCIHIECTVDLDNARFPRSIPCSHCSLCFFFILLFLSVLSLYSEKLEKQKNKAQTHVKKIDFQIKQNI